MIFEPIHSFKILDAFNGTEKLFRQNQSSAVSFNLFFSLVELVLCLSFVGAVGIMLGYHFKASCVLFAVPYWYILLLDTSTWNNHSYLYGLLAILLCRSSAHHCW